jgi:hypothetical protein
MSLPLESKSAAETLLDSALATIQSASIRDWANSAHNRPVWIRYAQATIDNGRGDAVKLATIILCNAIGL